MHRCEWTLNASPVPQEQAKQQYGDAITWCLELIYDYRIRIGKQVLLIPRVSFDIRKDACYIILCLVHMTLVVYSQLEGMVQTRGLVVIFPSYSVISIPCLFH